MKKILVFARVPMNLVCLDSVYRRIKGDFSVWGSAKPEKGSPQALFKSCGWEVKYVPRWMAKWVRWDMYISSDIYLLGRRAKVKVHTFHGISFKGRAYTEKVLDYDRLFLIGPYMLKKFVEKGILKENDPRAVKVGMPKLDALIDGTWTREGAREYLGLDMDTPVVLYAPTWGVASSLELYGDVLVDAVRNLGAKLVVKLHDHSLKEAKFRRKLREWMKKGVYVYYGVDVVPAMAASDMLVSDFSSVANEYMLLNRPVVYLFVSDFAKRYAETADEKMLFKGGLVVEKPSEKLLEDALRRSLDFPDEFAEERLWLRDLLFYNPGRATDAAVSCIKELLL